MEKVGKTISFLSRPEKSYLLLLTGAYEPSFEYFTATRWCRFLHITCRDLIGGFSCYSLISSIAINNKKIRYNGLAWFLIGEVQKENAAEILGLRPCGFRPRHSSKLANEFRLFTNYDPETRLGGREQEQEQ